MSAGNRVEAVKQGFPQREIADASFELQQEIDSGRRVVVGVNTHTDSDEGETSILRIDPALERKQVERLRAAKASRDTQTVRAALAELKHAAAGERNLLPLLIEAARVQATGGEIVQGLQEVWGSYREQPML